MARLTESNPKLVHWSLIQFVRNLDSKLEIYIVIKDDGHLSLSVAAKWGSRASSWRKLLMLFASTFSRVSAKNAGSSRAALQNQEMSYLYDCRK